jgi:predicted regulator of Ras-like GTPase activity (Roadblock/LC7/MglB family)
MLDTILDDIKDIGGYKAAAVLDSTGEVLVSDASNLKGDLDMAVAVFNDIFVTGHKTVDKLSLGMMKNMQFMTKDGIILMECSGAEERVHIHMFVILGADGNHALTRMQMAKAIPKAVDELSA